MKKKVIAILMLGILVAQPSNYVSAAEVKEVNNISVAVDEGFNNINKIDFSQSFKLGEPEYVVYYYMNRCYYCDLIKDKLVDYASKLSYRNIYAVQMELSNNITGWYSMKEHHTKYDIEIGKIDEDGKITYYDGESEEKYLNSKEKEYGIVETYSGNYEKYKKVNENAKENRVYAVDFTPRIDYSDTASFRVEGTPTAIWVKNGKIQMHAVGDDEILDLMDKFTESQQKH